MPVENGDAVEPSGSLEPTTTLADLAPFTVARVVDVRADGSDSARLKAMGVCVGRQVQLVQSGDPLIVRVVGIRIGLSRRLAEQVVMQPVDVEPSVSDTVGAE